MASAPAFVGLDLGTTSLRAVQVNARKGSVTHAAEVPIARGVVSHGQVADPKALAKALGSLWRKGRFTTRRVAFALPDTSVLTRQVDLPWMPDADFRAALRWQVGDALPVELDTVELDYRPIETFVTRDQHGQEVRMQRCLLVASSTAGVTEVCTALAKARLEPWAADVASFALLRAAEACSARRDDDDVSALIDIGAGDITVVIHSAGQPRFIRAVPQHAGETIVDGLSHQLGVDAAQASDLLMQAGLNGPPPVVATVAESSIFAALSTPASLVRDPQVELALDVINPWATALVGQVRDSLDYYQAGAGRTKVTSLQLSGRLAGLEGLVERLGTELRLPVSQLDLYNGPRWSAKAQKSLAPTMTLALGLALRGQDSGVRESAVRGSGGQP